MRIGLMIGPERGRYRHQGGTAPGRRPVGGGGRAGHGLDPPDPRRVRRPHRRHRGGRGDQPDRDRYGRGAGPAAASDRPGPAGPLGAGRVRGPPGRRPRASRTTGSSTRCSACPTSTPWPPCAPTSTCSTRPSGARARSMSRTTGSGSTTPWTSPTSPPPRSFSPRWVRSCSDCAGNGPTGPSCGWPTSGPSARTSCPPWSVPRRPPVDRRPAWWPASRSACAATDEIDAAVARTNRILAEAEVSPNYQRLLEQGDARSVGDILVAGSESTIRKRLQAFADAGVTDLSVRVVPIGEGRDELVSSSKRTRGLLASLASSPVSRDGGRSRRPCPRQPLRGAVGSGARRVASNSRPRSLVRARAVPNSSSSSRTRRT